MTSSQGVIWDMDGVLVDTAELHFLSWNLALSEVGIDFGRARFNQYFGMSNPDTLGALLGRPAAEAEIRQIAGRKEALFAEYVKSGASPIPGAIERLKDWHAQGIRQALATSAPQMNIDRLLGPLGILTYFQAIASAGDGPSKPEPAVFLRAAEALGLPPERCVVLEDAPVGIEAARRAGMKCIALTTTRPATELGQADIIVSGFEELPPGILDQLIS
jgi:HAD superfamily hydrolase (TIGR01509 family)